MKKKGNAEELKKEKKKKLKRKKKMQAFKYYLTKYLVKCKNCLREKYLLKKEIISFLELELKCQSCKKTLIPLKDKLIIMRYFRKRKKLYMHYWGI